MQHPAPVAATVAVDPRVAPADCQSMADVRQGVDALDRALVALLAERQRYMDAAARIKPDRDAVFDQARIDDVVEKVLVAAQTHGLSPDIAEPVWRLLIDRCIAHEFSTWDRTRV
ncbi:chorismate mutase [Brevundimonas sp. SORGH_AS_0993]|uniref:chorismate mutase n=1 Tax=Brevundimonas sp. SORGH_AS_0993 TaxID=3041794 RepID=UPI00277EDC26|nr:chorismate mutase [Brevundimonas sp. SORGH_AS_0993]MDQ1153268.1 isochorismate pyruvate lyase [Brevundimonas sp. SORGH_AS_0993]